MLTDFENTQTSLNDDLLAFTDLVLRELDGHYKENPVKSKAIEENIGLCGTEVRAIMHYLRCQETPIGSSGSGYYLARNREELAPVIESLEQRANAIQHVAYKLRQCFPESDV